MLNTRRPCVHSAYALAYESYTFPFLGAMRDYFSHVAAVCHQSPADVSANNKANS